MRTCVPRPRGGEPPVGSHTSITQCSPDKNPASTASQTASTSRWVCTGPHTCGCQPPPGPALAPSTCLNASSSPRPRPERTSDVGTLAVVRPALSISRSLLRSTSCASSCWEPSTSKTTGSDPGGQNRKSHRRSPSTSDSTPAAAASTSSGACGISHLAAPVRRSSIISTNRSSSLESHMPPANSVAPLTGTRKSLSSNSPATPPSQVSRSSFSASGCMGGDTPLASSLSIVPTAADSGPGSTVPRPTPLASLATQHEPSNPARESGSTLRALANRW